MPRPPKAENHAQRLTLRIRQPLQALQHRRAQLLQGGVRQLHLRLDASDPGDPHASRRRDRVLQQSGLADSGLAMYHQHGAATGARRLQQLAERRALGQSI